MHIWFGNPTVNDVNNICKNTIIDLLEIEFTDIGHNYISGTMPLNNKTRQPHGLLHGGASCVLAETLGSAAATMCLDQKKQFAVGLNINSNHLKSVRCGNVTAKATPIRIGKKIHLWEIKMYDQCNNLCCLSTLTVAIRDINKK